MLCSTGYSHAEAEAPHPTRNAVYGYSGISAYSQYKNCVYWMAKKHKVEEILVLSVIAQERGTPNRSKRNRDGTFDHSIMQINDKRENQLTAAGYSFERIKTDPCYNIDAGTFLLANELNKAPDTWTGVGRYHYGEWGAYPRHHHKYKSSVYRHFISLVDIVRTLSKHTYQVANK